MQLDTFICKAPPTLKPGPSGQGDLPVFHHSCKLPGAPLPMSLLLSAYESEWAASAPALRHTDAMQPLLLGKISTHTKYFVGLATWLIVRFGGVITSPQAAALSSFPAPPNLAPCCSSNRLRIQALCPRWRWERAKEYRVAFPCWVPKQTQKNENRPVLEKSN